MVREITRIFEEVVGGLGYFAGRWKDVPPKGEITLVVSGAPASETSSRELPGLTMEDLTTAGRDPPGGQVDGPAAGAQ